jgi:caffeoyl-CoA O-methyltransferase
LFSAGMRGLCLFMVVLTAATTLVAARATDEQQNLDDRVKKFLDEKQGQWRDLNVPVVDGQTLHDIVVKNKYTRALEIGTSTGHSGIWIAWASAKLAGS